MNRTKAVNGTTIAVVLVALAMLGSPLVVMASSLSANGSGSSAGSVMPAAGSLAPGAISPASPVIDQGQTVELSATATGGTGPYYYVWYAGSFSQCSGDLPPGGAVVGTSQGAVYTSFLNLTVSNTTEWVCYGVNDSATPTHNGPVYSATDQVTVDPPFVGGTVTYPTPPSAPVLDTGQSVTLTANPSGGTGKYTYQWFSGTAAKCVPQAIGTALLSGDTQKTLTVSPSASQEFCVQENDTSVAVHAQGALPTPVLVQVVSDVVPGSPTPSGWSGDAGQQAIFSVSGVSVAYGTPTYQWYSGTSSNCSKDPTAVPATQGGNTSRITVNPTATTTYCYTVHDSSTTHPNVPSTTVQATVNGTLSAGSISPAAPLLDPGQAVTLTANPSGGYLTSPQGYTYQWYSGTYSQCASDKTVLGTTPTIIALASSGTLYYCVTVTDADSVSATSSTDLVTVEPALQAGSASPVGPEVDVGQQVTLIASPSGGTGPGTYSYQWFTTTPTGSCTKSESLIPGATGQQYVVSPSSEVNVSYVYRVVDLSYGALSATNGWKCSTPDNVTVSSDPTALAPVVASSPGTTIDSGQTEFLNASASASGGTPVLLYQWRGGTSSNCSSTSDASIPSATATTYTAAPGSTEYFCYSVSDGSINPPTVYSPTVLITVNSLPLAGAITTSGVPVIDLNASPVAESVNLTANGAGGTGTLTYQWFSGGSANCQIDTTPVYPGDTTASVTVPVANGGTPQTLDYCYRVTDAQHKSAVTSTGFQVTVNSRLTAGPPTSSALSIDVGQTYQVTTAKITTGTAPYSYQWFTSSSSSSCAVGDLSLVAGATSSTYTVTPTTSYLAGLSFCYRVTDSSNGTTLQESAYSSSPVVVKVFGQLTAGALKCSDATSGFTCSAPKSPTDSITLTENASGGNSTNYAFQWYKGTSSVCSSDTAIPGATGPTYSVVTPIPASGIYYCYTVTDSHVTPAFTGETAISVTWYQRS